MQDNVEDRDDVAGGQPGEEEEGQGPFKGWEADVGLGLRQPALGRVR